jgi:hypothetical protein
MAHIQMREHVCTVALSALVGLSNMCVVVPQHGVKNQHPWWVHFFTFFVGMPLESSTFLPMGIQSRHAYQHARSMRAWLSNGTNHVRWFSISKVVGLFKHDTLRTREHAPNMATLKTLRKWPAITFKWQSFGGYLVKL